MSTVTTVPVTDVQATYDVIRQQLPSVESADTFSSAQEIAIAQLAIAYCDALVEGPTARSTYLPGLQLRRHTQHCLRRQQSRRSY